MSDVLEEVQAENLRALGDILRRKNEEILRLREENAELRGQLTRAQAQMDAEDAEVFRLIHEKPELSPGAIHIVLSRSPRKSAEDYKALIEKGIDVL